MPNSVPANAPTLAHIQDTTWVIIPGFNEEKYVAQLLEKVKRHTRNIIFVDDGSQDSTADIARQHTPHVLRHRINLGKGAALKTGTLYAFEKIGAQNVIFMDADDQHSPHELTQFWQALQEGNDVVFGIREQNEHMPLVRKLGNYSASFFLQLLFGRYIPDIPSGYKALARRAYPLIAWKAQGYEVELEIAARVAARRLPFAMVPISTIYHDADKGVSILDVLSLFKYLLILRVTL